jgi:DNA polymerase (family 10)
MAAVHYKFDLSRKAQTERIIRAMDNRHVSIIAHPTGRLIGERDAYDVDMETVIAAAHERGCHLELNADPDRLDLNDIHVHAAKEAGVKVAISTDAHSTGGFANIRFGVDQARRGWLEAADVINTLPLARLQKLLKR